MKRRLALNVLGRHPSQRPIDRVIDYAIIAFLLFSVLSITGAQAAILVALAAWVYDRVTAAGHRPRRVPLLAPMAAFYLTSVLASVTAVDPLHSFRALRDVFEPAFFFLLVDHLRSQERLATLSYILIAAASVMAIYGLTQSLTQGSAFRVHGTMSIYMTFAGILMLVALVVLAHLLYHPPGRWAWGLVCSLVLLTAALVMTQTRGAWLGLAAGGVFILGCRQKWLLLGLPLVAAVVFLAAPTDVRARIRSFGDLQDVTALERLYMWDSGLRMLRDYPWTGVGIQGVKRVYGAYKHPNAVREQRGHLHNNVLQIAAERGLLGLCCWLWIWTAFYRQSWIIFGRLEPDDLRSRALVISSLASVTSFHVAGLFEYNFGDSEVIMLVYFLMTLPFVVNGAGHEARLHATSV